MKKDFTIKILKELLNELKKRNYEFITFLDSLNCKKDRYVILRHDIDKLTKSTLKIAEIENEFGIKGTYYFRALKCSFNIEIIKKVVSLGHEVGYHYEDLAIAKGDYEKAIEIFKRNLEMFRKYYPVQTICMHGNPLSRWDNRLLWQRYDYKNFGIIGEPYFNVDFNEVFYLTDTGRRWDGIGSVRDKVNNKIKNKYKTTEDIIIDIRKDIFPNKTLFTIHPQRWTDDSIIWIIELIRQFIKNKIKRYLTN